MRKLFKIFGKFSLLVSSPRLGTVNAYWNGEGALIEDESELLGQEELNLQISSNFGFSESMSEENSRWHCHTALDFSSEDIREAFEEIYEKFFYKKETSYLS